MQILLTGGTGLVGRALCRHFSQQGHSLIVLSRDPGKVAGLCSGARGIGSLEELNVTDAVDAVINLAGAPIADRPWTKGRRRMLRESRIDLTRNLVDWMSRRDQAPGVLLSASATGWYGDRGEEQLDETSAAPVADFASQLCQDWEAEVMRAAELGTRVACLRFAPVLAADGGMLARLLPVFRLGLGGRLGSGQQWMPWIHLDDLVRLFDHLLSNDGLPGHLQRLQPDAGAQCRIYPYSGADGAPSGHFSGTGLAVAPGTGRDVDPAYRRPACDAQAHRRQRLRLAVPGVVGSTTAVAA